MLQSTGPQRLDMTEQLNNNYGTNRSLGSLREIWGYWGRVCSQSDCQGPVFLLCPMVIGFPEPLRLSPG